MIKLSKPGDSHKLNLAKSEKVTIHCNLTWKAAATQPPKSGLARVFGGWFGGGTPEKQDLDLGCMWEDKNGNKYVVQALRNCFGSRDVHPFIQLDQDDRTGNSENGENLYIFDPSVLKRVLIFAYIYEGTAFAAVDAKLKISVSNGEQIELDLDAPSRDRSFCGAALIEIKGDEITVRKENKYFSGHQECDQEYGFGFQWTQASK